MNRKTILLVDPDEDSLAVYSAAFRFAGYRVEMTGEETDGIRRAREGQPDLVITDLVERTQTGWSFVEGLRSDERTREIPIVALTARVLEEDRELAMASGCDHYLLKPLQPRELVAFTDSILPVDPGDALPQENA